LGEIAHQLALAGQVSQALQVANSIPNTEAKALAIIAIARVLQTTKQESQASKLLQDLPYHQHPQNPMTIGRLSRSATLQLHLLRLDKLSVLSRWLNRSQVTWEEKQP
jgi:hypothetical protein